MVNKIKFHKKYFSAILLLLGGISTIMFHRLYTTDTISDTKNKCLSIMTQDGAIKNEIYQLLSLSKVDCGSSLEEIVKATQRPQGSGGWLRKPGLERWDIDELNDEVSQIDTYMVLFEKLDMIKEIEPSQNHYTYVFLLGATTERVRSRLAHLIKLWNNGIRFDTIVVLGGDRDLEKKIENETVLYHSDILPIKTDWEKPITSPSNEYEMMKMVFDQVSFPTGFEKVEQVWINTPKIKTADGSFRRPNTSDTINSWLATCPKKGSILAISNQPYVGYQHACLKTYVPQGFTIETIGDRVSEKEKLAILFDTLARWLYQQRECQKIRN